MAQKTSQTKLDITNVGQPRPNRLVAEYDFAVDGGGIGQITLRGDTLPSGAQVRSVDIIVVTPVTGGAGATLSLDSEAVADLQAAVVVTGAPWSTAGDAASFKKVVTTADRAIKCTVAVNALTAGKFLVVVDYHMIGAL